LATGAGFAARQLYTNGEEFVFWAKRPIILNGIVEPASRPDLLERSLIVPLPTISPEKRRPEGAIMASFEKAWPQILGAVLDTVVLLLRRLPEVELTEHPRMADFAHWAAAAAPAFNAEAGEMVDMLFEKQSEALLSDLDNPVVQAVLKLLDDGGGKVEMQLSELLSRLNEIAPEDATNARAWPKIPRQLRSALLRLAPVLRATGVVVDAEGRTNRGRVILIERMTMGADKRAVGDDEVTMNKIHRHPLTSQNCTEMCNQTPLDDDCDDDFSKFSVELKDKNEGEIEKEKPRILSSPSSPDAFRMIEI
jgi:hypothetical protein